MAKPLKFLPYLLVLAVSAVSLACGGGNAAVTGANETPGSSGAPSQSLKGATIQGTLRSSTAAGSVSASSDVSAASMGGIKVSVVGTSIQVTTNGSGEFTLTGVSAGTAELRFQGKGLDATLTVGGLVAGQTLTLTFQVNGNSVSKVGDDNQGDDQQGDDHQGDDNNGKNQVDFEGSISSLSPLTIAGRHVTTNSSTRYFGAHHASVPASDVLKVGNKVEVEGQQQADKSVLASQIQLGQTED
jgi:uncharacterized protein DUF5666